MPLDGSNDCLTPCESGPKRSASIAGQVFLRHLHKSFNNPNEFDLKITSDKNVVYCRKSVIAIRNQMFAAVLNSRVNSDNQMEVSSESFDAFQAFLQYIHGIEPQIDLKIVKSLQKMAQLFDEPELEDLSAQRIQEIIKTIDESSVCALYETAINENLLDLEKSCVEFASTNWKDICRSDQFQAMDDKISKQLMIAVMKRLNV